MARPVDLVDVVEAAYDLETDAGEWVRRIATASRPLLDRGVGVAAYSFDISDPSNPRVDHVVTLGGRSGLAELVQNVTAACTPEEIAGTFGRDQQCQTASTALGRPLMPLQEHGSPLGIRDGLGISAIDVDGHGVMLTAGLPTVTTPSPSFKWRWTRVAVHLAAGHRLRRRLDGPVQLGAVDAVVSPDGNVHHARGNATHLSSRVRLRELARQIDRARTKQGCQNPDEALDLWQGLVSGEWSLVDHFDSDGRRFLVAHANAPHAPDPRSLTPQERRIVALAIQGKSYKLIAYTLGLSKSTVGAHLRRAMKKLGCRSRTELARAVRGQLASPQD